MFSLSFIMILRLINILLLISNLVIFFYTMFMMFHDKYIINSLVVSFSILSSLYYLYVLIVPITTTGVRRDHQSYFTCSVIALFAFAVTCVVFSIKSFNENNHCFEAAVLMYEVLTFYMLNVAIKIEYNKNNSGYENLQ